MLFWRISEEIQRLLARIFTGRTAPAPDTNSMAKLVSRSTSIVAQPFPTLGKSRLVASIRERHARIREHLRGAAKEAWFVGRDLLVLRELLGRQGIKGDGFVSFIEKNCEFSKSTAYLYMSLHKNYRSVKQVGELGLYAAYQQCGLVQSRKDDAFESTPFRFSGKQVNNDHPVYSSYTVQYNDELIAEVSRLYLKRGDKIADITYGRGFFWRKVDVKQFDFHKSDLLTCPKAPYDFRALPYKDSEFTVVVFDPPYTSHPHQLGAHRRYQNNLTTSGSTHTEIVAMYKAGMSEAHRILRRGGLLWLKCKDEIDGQKQRWTHIEIHDIAVKMGFTAVDLFVMSLTNVPVQGIKQHHARKNHSYLWIFKR